jgi:hypothetical protein
MIMRVYFLYIYLWGILQYHYSNNQGSMKAIISGLLFLSIFINPVFSQQDFKVIKVNGTIVLKTRGISLETGTVFSDKEDLLFRSEDATAAVINSQKGRIVLTNRNHDLSKAKSNSLPSMYNISTRGVTGNKSDLTTQFSGKCVILDRQSLKIDEKAYPMDNDNFFFLRYIYKGESINKKLDSSFDSLIIDKKTLLTVDGNPIPGADNTSIKLFYHKGSESVFISDFDLIFPDMKQLTREIEIILAEIKEKPVKEKIGEIDSYITEFYGKVNRENLITWIESNFGIK